MDVVEKLGLKKPLIVAPMAGGPTTPELVIASCKAGALGSWGGAYMTGTDLISVVEKIRLQTRAPLNINLFIPDNTHRFELARIERAIEATARFRNELHLQRPEVKPPFEENFDKQFEAVLKLKPAVFSFVFGLLSGEKIREAREAGILVVGGATTVEEALAQEDSGVDAIVLQGFEAGGHRAILDPEASDPGISCLDLLAECSKRLELPLIAAGGIMNSENIRRALQAGAVAVQMGTAFLACREAGTSAPYRRALSAKRNTKLTRAFSGRLARGIENRFMSEVLPDSILPFPIQNKFTRDIRNASIKAGRSDYLSLWCGTGEGELWQGSAGDLIQSLFPD